MTTQRTGRARWKWVAALAAVLSLSAVAYRGLEPERLDPEDLLPPDAERAANAEALLAAVSGPSVGPPRVDPVDEAVRRGRELYEAWRYDEAREALELALELDPGASEAWFNLGLVELRQPGNLERSVAAFEKAIELDPRDGRFPLGLAGAIGAQVMSRGSLLAGAARVPRVKELLQQAVELDPGSVDARNALFQFYLRVPGLLGGGVARAEEQAAALEELDPVEGRLARAQVEGEAERFEQAEALYRQALAADPERAATHRALGGFLARRERHEEALACFEACARLAPEDPASHEALGGGLREAGRTEEAEAAFRRALECNPDSLMAAMQLAACLDERGDVGAAAALYRCLVERLGDSPWAETAREWLEEHPEERPEEQAGGDPEEQSGDPAGERAR